MEKIGNTKTTKKIKYYFADLGNTGNVFQTEEKLPVKIVFFFWDNIFKVHAKTDSSHRLEYFYILWYKQYFSK